jgi:CRISPR/Cas system-associated protein Cas5 (RAMP superfamily)
MVRINHGLRPKYADSLPSSGFALMMEKIGVLEDNIKRGKLFKEREQQLFDIIKKLWNAHHKQGKSKRFNEDASLEVTYVQPEFPVDPKTKVEQLMLESKVLRSGDRFAIKKMYPHLSDVAINKMIREQRRDLMEDAKFKAEVQVEGTKIIQDSGIMEIFEVAEESTTNIPNTDNKVKHAADSSKQLKTPERAKGQDAKKNKKISKKKEE